MTGSMTSQFTTVFDPIREEMDQIKVHNQGVTFDYEDPAQNKLARSHIFKLRKVKSRIADAHKTAKADALAVCKALDEIKRAYTAEVEEMIAVHETPIREIEEREARKAAEETARILREKEEAERKAREELEQKQRDIERREREIAEREAAIRRQEEEAKRRDAEEEARRVEAERRAREEAAQKAEAEKQKAELERRRIEREGQCCLEAIADIEQYREEPAEDILRAIRLNQIRHVRFVVEP